MEDLTTLTVNGLDVNYIRRKEVAGIRAAKTSTVCFFLLILVLSVLLLWFQISENSFLSEISKYSRIKSSVKGWRNLVDSKTKLESDKGRLIAAGRKELLSFSCIDFGPYFLPSRLDEKTFLPQAIRRGKGDGWMIHKASKIDPSAQQFCEYIVRNHEDTITCGNEMMKELGYSGYFEKLHWCSEFNNLLT